MATKYQVSAAFRAWQDAIAEHQVWAAKEAREMFVMLRSEQPSVQRPGYRPTSCAACNGTLAEIARLTDSLQAHQQLPSHQPAAERQ